ncbi:hypothetical protein P8452_16774 [Trifolium repens]|nr:hypothetical protein P8452_16774 [Trifolium repens]
MNAIVILFALNCSLEPENGQHQFFKDLACVKQSYSYGKLAFEKSSFSIKHNYMNMSLVNESHYTAASFQVT